MGQHETVLIAAMSNNEGSGEPVQMHRLIRAFIALKLKVWMQMKV